MVRGRRRLVSILDVALLCAVSMLLPFATAIANPVVRSADHAGFGRLVFEFDDHTGFALKRDGDHVIIAFDRPDVVPGATVPRNVLAYHGEPGLADLQVVPGATLRTSTIGNRVVIDIHNPAVAARHTKDAQLGPRTRVLQLSTVRPAPATSVDTKPAAAQSAERVLRLPVPKPANADALALAVEHALAAPVEPISQVALQAPIMPTPAATMIPADPSEPAAAQAAPPLATRAPSPSLGPPVSPGATYAVTAVPVPPDQTGAAGILLPFSRGTGAAVFRRGDNYLLVFDERRPIDVGALRIDPKAPALSVQLLLDATVVTLPEPPGRAVWLDPVAEGWVARSSTHPRAVEKTSQAVGLLAADGHLALKMDGAGRSLVVPDRMTGGLLLVGTQHRSPPSSAGPPSAQGVAVSHQSSGLILLASEQGVAAEPLSDRVSMRATQNGFELDVAGGDALIPQRPSDFGALTEGAALTRRFDFPARPMPDLLRRMDTLVADAAAAPPRARLAPRLAAAQAMIALGLGPEAQALLRVALTDDPQAVEAPDLAALSAIGGLLVGRPDGENALGDARLNGTDEIAFWRGVAATYRRDSAAAAAAFFATTLPLVMSYPDPLRARLLPMVAETLVQGGETVAAERLLAAAKDDRNLTFARGLMEEAQGRIDAALSIYDAIAKGHDRLIGARASDQAIALRLGTGRIDPGEAADALERGLFDWRETPRELAQRRKIAGLRAQSHSWRKALAMLRETAKLFPEESPALHAELHDLFAAMLQDQPSVGALDLVMIADENADLMSEGESGETAAMLLADRLTSLDLPNRAIPLLDRLMRGAKEAKVRAQLGFRLAAMRLSQSDANGALASLAASDAADLPAEIGQSRQMIEARALDAKGDVSHAQAILRNVYTSQADLLRAEFSTRAKDWPGAEAALQTAAARIPKTAGPMAPNDQDTLLRLAGAAAQAGDEAELGRLAVRSGNLDGHRVELFRMLTAPPVAGLGDLPRAEQEAAAARDVPNQVRTLAATGQSR